MDVDPEARPRTFARDEYMFGILEYCHEQDDKCSLLKAAYLAAHTVKYHGPPL